MRDDCKTVIEKFHLSFTGKQIKLIENTESVLDADETVLYLDITNLSIVTAGHRRIQIAPGTLVLLTDRRVFLRQPGVFKPITEDIPLRKIQSVESREDAENAGHLLLTASGSSYDIMIAQNRKIREVILHDINDAVRNHCSENINNLPSDTADDETSSAVLAAGKENSDTASNTQSAQTKLSSTNAAQTQSAPAAAKPKNYRYFSHKDCEYFPCHKGADPDNFNCLFCYCPFYLLGDQCGGNFRYLSTGTKDCTNCLYPHLRENYDKITARYQEIREAMPAPNTDKPV